MEAIDLKSPSNLFVADDIIKTAKELQTDIADTHPEMQPDIAVQAMEVLGDPRELYGGTKVYVHALGAIVLTKGIDSASLDEDLFHRTYFAEVTFRSHFSRFAYIQHPALRSLCLTLFESQVISSPGNENLVGERIQSGVYVPVHGIESVFAA